MPSFWQADEDGALIRVAADIRLPEYQKPDSWPPVIVLGPAGVLAAVVSFLICVRLRGRTGSAISGR